MRSTITIAVATALLALDVTGGRAVMGTDYGTAAAQGGDFRTEEQNMILVTRQATPAVVGVQRGGGAGSGVIIRQDGVILTNAHVVGTSRQVTVSFADGSELVGTVLGRDPSVDIAVIRVEADNLPMVPLGDSDLLEVGQLAIAIGNPLRFERTVTRGIISGLNRSLANLPELIQTDAAINRGNSGGPLLNSAGEVIGINTAVIQPDYATGLGFAVPINLARDVADQLLTTGVIRRARLGIGSREITAETASRFQLPVREGILVTEVEAGSPAAAAGLRQGDIIVRLGEMNITGHGDLARFLRQRRPGDTTTILMLRDGREITVEARLAETILSQP